MARLPRIIAVDFDGCLVENKYPDIGPANLSVVDAVRREQARGSKIILWTCRADAFLCMAIDWCEDQEIRLDAVNENLPEVIEMMGSDSRKVYASEYWDDRAVTKP